MIKVNIKQNVIKNFLAKKNKSQNWFAMKLGISSGYMSKLLLGDRHPSPKIREKILEILNELKFDDIFRIEK